jgi:hypothetical protein
VFLVAEGTDDGLPFLSRTVADSAWDLLGAIGDVSGSL